MRASRKVGFTVIELLVVIAIVFVLISLLLALSGQVREHARRAMCASRLRQLAQADFAYAADYGYFVPGTRDASPGSPTWTAGEHCIWISWEAYTAFAKYGNTDKLVVCPNLEADLPFKASYDGWVIGYNYLAGHALASQANGWVSPMRPADPATLPMAADLNDYSPQDLWTVVPHPRTTRDSALLVYDAGLSPAAYGGEGGNEAFCDGSVRWVPLSEMKVHGTYSGNGGAYLGMW